MIKLEEAKMINKEINVKTYLTYDQIQYIVEAVCKFDSWAEREQNIDILLLHYATDLSDAEIEEFGHSALLQSGVIDEVKASVKNYNRIHEAIDYTQSTARAMNQIVKELPKLLEPLKKVTERGAKSSKK